MAVGGLALFLKNPQLEPSNLVRYLSKRRRAQNLAEKNGRFLCLFRDFAAETRRLEEGEGVEAAEAAAPPGEPPGYSRSKKRTLEELFKPPLDIMHKVRVQSGWKTVLGTGSACFWASRIRILPFSHKDVERTELMHAK